LEVVSTGERPIRNNTFLLNNQGTATVKLFVRDDDIFQGLTMGSLKVKAGDKLRVVAPKPLSILIDDNEPLPAILSLHGTMIPDPQDINNRELVTLTEADVSITATLRIKLEEPAARDLMIGLHLGGTASKQDSRLGPSEFLLAETTEDFE